MRTLLWTAVWWLLVGELAITSVLVVPVPRQIRNFIARTFVNRLGLGQRLSSLGIFIFIALSGALSESISTVLQIQGKIREQKSNMMTNVSRNDNIYENSLSKQQLFRSERNVYLAGFSLTLLLVIIRICKLMQESVELEDELKALKPSSKKSSKAVNDTHIKGGGGNMVDGGDGIEMTAVRKKPRDKKKD